MNNLKKSPCFPFIPILSMIFALILLATHLNYFIEAPNFKSTTQEGKKHLHFQNHIQLLAHSKCKGTLYPHLCVSTLSTFPNLETRTMPQIISKVVNHTVHEVKSSSNNCTTIFKNLQNTLNTIEKRALDDCLKLFDDTIVELNTTILDLSKNPSSSSSSSSNQDLQTLLSGAMTNLYTCLDGFSQSKNGNAVRGLIEEKVIEISHHVSNSLAMLKKVKTSLKKEEVFAEYGTMKKRFPSWVSAKDRKLLEGGNVNETKIDVVVAKDGSGNFTTIGEAVVMAPNSSTTRFVIYIKSGAYLENVEVIRKKTNLMFIGDGIGRTIVKASRNVVDGWTTFQSATVAVVGEGFIAKGITFENSAGPDKHQAVALRSGADFSAFYKCSFVGYQDTLYVHSMRQFYRDCDIYGTVDFIFGNAAVLFQNCNLYARKPNENQKNLFTAQGREDPNQNTGISILNCKIAAASDLIPVKSSFKSYLGRPWKLYSRTVYLRSYMEDLIDPKGWLEWNETFALDTLYYGEYMNKGPGSNTSGRVNWPGFRVINSSNEANQFTVSEFIQGSEWLNNTGIPFFYNLS